jgi:glutathione synthase
VEVIDIVQIGASAEGSVRRLDMSSFDLVWVMNQPHPAIAREAWQLLWLLSQCVPFVNSLSGMLFANNKNALGAFVPAQNLVESYSSNEFLSLWELYCERRHLRWIVKPPNGGCGADVFLLEPDGNNAKAILQSMTGNTEASGAVTDRSYLGFQNRYAVLQGFIPQVRAGEKRVVLAGGRVLTQHGRLPSSNDHRSNMTQGGTPVAADLDAREMELCGGIAQRLSAHGVNFVGVDLAYPYVLEFNIVNPGGLQRVQALTGVDHTPGAIDLILRAVMDPERDRRGRIDGQGRPSASIQVVGHHGTNEGSST